MINYDNQQDIEMVVQEMIDDGLLEVYIDQNGDEMLELTLKGFGYGNTFTEVLDNYMIRRNMH